MKKFHMMVAGSVLMAALLGCSVESDNAAFREKSISSIQTAMQHGQKLAYIQEIKQEGTVYKASINFIDELFVGQDAKNAVIEDNPACKNDTSAGCALAYGAYIRDKNGDLVSLPASADVEILMDQNDPFSGASSPKISIKELQNLLVMKKGLSGELFLVTVNSNGEIQKLEEEFTPFS